MLTTHSTHPPRQPPTHVDHLNHHPLDHLNLPDDHTPMYTTSPTTHHLLTHYLHPPATTTQHAYHMTTLATRLPPACPPAHPSPAHLYHLNHHMLTSCWPLQPQPPPTHHPPNHYHFNMHITSTGTTTTRLLMQDASSLLDFCTVYDKSNIRLIQ
jgi:hypothetical protein